MKRKILPIVIVLGLLLALVAVPAQAAVPSRTYTLDADFAEGTLVGVEYITVPDQLQLTEEAVTLPFIWVPNNEGTISKVNTETGNETGRYWVSGIAGSSPSRTTVDLQGNCWVGCRTAGTVVKVGLFEGGQWIDRNNNSICDTSQDLNNDGDITGAEILPWGEDECVLYEVVLIPGKEGTYVPGTYVGGYDIAYWGTSPRGLAVDASNNLWAGTWNSQKYHYINGTTCNISNTIDVSTWGHFAYGAVIDGNGILWSARLSSHVLRLNPGDLTYPETQTISLGHTYGLGLDYQGNLFVGGGGWLSKIDTENLTNPLMWTKSAKTVRGVVCTDDNNVWVAGANTTGGYAGVSRYDNDGNWVTTIDGFNAPSGVAVDAAGKIWGCNINDTYLHRIDPGTNTIDLSKSIVNSGGHYSYSDMTGIVSRTITTKIGTWTVDFDSEKADMPWGTVSWSSLEPDGTSVTVQVRSSNDKVTWSGWEAATSGVVLSATPDGRYLQIETTLQTTENEVSPILYDLTVEVGNLPPTADPNGPYLGAAGSPIAFDGTGSSDPDSDPLTYAWTYGDSNTGTGATPTHAYAAAGIYPVCLTVNDGKLDSDQVCTYAVVYDPSAGFVTGGGCIDSPAGAYVPDPLLAGKANFGFVSKYKKGVSTPTGNTEFQFHAGDLNFHSSSYDWLVVTGSNYARFKGSGTINNDLDPNGDPYKFMLWAGDGPDTFRIKIWYEDSGEVVVYDNGFDQAIAGGQIVIHTKK